MDAHSLEIGDKNDGDVILRIICAKGVQYEGNPVYLHSHVLSSKSNFFQARLSERWSLHISPLEIKITVIPNGLAKNYIKCIRFMYSSYKGRGIHFSGVEEALDILPIASELLFEEGIQACMNYLEAVPWTLQQSIKINSLLSVLQVSVSADLSARLEISNSFTTEKLEFLKKKLPDLLSVIGEVYITHSMSLLIMEQHFLEIFQGNACPAVEEVYREAIINEFSLKIEGVKKSQILRSSYDLLWLVDITKLCNSEIFETAFKMFVEDLQLADILLHEGKLLRFNRFFSESFSNYLLQILVDRFLKGLANGDIIVPKSLRISFLRIWVPVMACHICNIVNDFDNCYDGSQRFVKGVTKVVGTLHPNDQKALYMFWTNSFQGFGGTEKRYCQWWIDTIWLGVSGLK